MVVIASGVSSYGLYLMTGKTPFSNFKLPVFSVSTPDLSNINPLSKGTDTAFKWTDENGVIHYSNEPPAGGEHAEIIEVNPDTNLIQGTEITQTATKEPAKTVITPVEGPVYAPENIQKLMDDAKNVEKVLQERHKQQEEILNKL